MTEIVANGVLANPAQRKAAGGITQLSAVSITLRMVSDQAKVLPGR